MFGLGPCSIYAAVFAEMAHGVRSIGFVVMLSHQHGLSFSLGSDTIHNPVALEIDSRGKLGVGHATNMLYVQRESMTTASLQLRHPA